MATTRPTFSAASRIRPAVSACSSAVPWAKFSRATSRPAATIRSSTSGSREAGPIVATIFVERIGTADPTRREKPALSGGEVKFVLTLERPSALLVPVPTGWHGTGPRRGVAPSPHAPRSPLGSRGTAFGKREFAL